MIYRIYVDATNELCGEFIAPNDLHEAIVEQRSRKVIVTNGYGSGKSQLYWVGKAQNENSLGVKVLTFNCGMY